MEITEAETTPATAITMDVQPYKWPKTPPPLTEEQERLRGEFLKIWHEIMPKKYSSMEKFNHACSIVLDPLKNKVNPKTLEVGSGLGEHLFYEDLSNQDYTALEIRPDFVEIIKKRFPGVKAIVGDIQSRLELPDHTFDRIMAIHVLEHLRNLPKALREISRLLKPDGTFVAVIPCEGGLSYALARRISAQRIFEKTFKVPYRPIIENEHVSTVWELLDELESHFDIEKKSFWPLKVPIVTANLIIALSCKLKTPLLKP